MSYQKIIIVGNLGQDPEVKYLDTGVCVANFSVATSESYKDRNGDRVTQTEWFRCVAWRKTAEVAEKYIHKGSKVLLELKKKDEKYTDKQTQQERTITKFQVLSLQMLDPKPQAQGESYQEPIDSVGTTGQPVTEQPPQQNQDAPFPGADNGPDDLPF
jgi:single-strand DNA-binding protein